MNEYPKWIKATVPDVGEVAVLAQSEAEEAAVLDGTAEIVILKAAPEAGGDSYSIKMPEAEPEAVEEIEEPEIEESPEPPPAAKSRAKHVKARRR